MSYEHKQGADAMTRSNYHAGSQPYIITEEILDELSRARSKFPEQSMLLTLAALTEEVGELNQAVLQFNLEPDKGTTEQDIYKEAVQVACMAIRVALDCQYKITEAQR